MNAARPSLAGRGLWCYTRPMRARIRKLFLLVSALGYGFLGGGPSLWALDLKSPDPVMACLQMGCTCRLHPGSMKGGVCCCVRNLALLRKYPALASDPKFWKALGLDPPSPRGTSQLHQDGCGPLDSGHGMGPVPQQAHFPPTALFQALPSRSLCLEQPACRGRSKNPEPPQPGPD
ncbi:MAG TPA: hypothetical protein VK914_13320 [bacterium]|jgi:hypothetical protein|nr:hypothetical protein [bacterium]